MMQDQTLRAWQLLCDRTPNEEALTEIEKARGFYRTRSIRSGDLLEVEAYPILPKAVIREALIRCPISTEAQRQLNQINAEKRIIRLTETNFGEDDWYFTATLEGPNLPTLEGVRKMTQDFVKRLNYRRKCMGLGNARYIYVIEGYEEGSQQKRLHVHFVLDGDLDRATIKKTWGKGRCSCDELDPEGYDGLERLAKYLVKDPRGRKRWAASKGLKDPVIRVADRKINHRTARRIATNRAGAQEALEKLYPGYELKNITVKTNPFISGCYIYAVLRRKNEKERGKREQGYSDRQGRDGPGTHAGKRRDGALRVSSGGAQEVQKREGRV